jgi:hypothetical protein
MATRFAWVLNLDADLELAEGSRYTPTSRVESAMRPHAERLARELLGAGDVWVDDPAKTESAAGLVGRAFCPTPRALARLRQVGAEPEAHPPFEVLRRVNSRAFAAGLGATLEGALFVTDVDVARAMLARPPAISQAWRIKPAFGMAGRGQRVVRPGAPNAAVTAWLRARIGRDGGIQVEPHVLVDVEYAIHGVLSTEGAPLVWGPIVRQRCDTRGAWLATEPIAEGDLPRMVASALPEEARRVASALHAAGYFGPFGVDAFTYRDRAGRPLFQPRSEINARYSMGMARSISLIPTCPT